MQIVSLVCHGYCANKSRYSYYTCTFLGNFVLTGLFKHIFWGNRGTDQIRDVLKAPSLLAITIDSQRLLPQRLKTIIHEEHFNIKNEVHRHQGAKRGPATGGYLSNKIADNTAIIDAHARTICVEDPGDPHLNQKQSNIMYYIPRKLI